MPNICYGWVFSSLLLMSTDLGNACASSWLRTDDDVTAAGRVPGRMLRPPIRHSENMPGESTLRFLLAKIETALPFDPVRFIIIRRIQDRLDKHGQLMRTPESAGHVNRKWHAGSFPCSVRQPTPTTPGSPQ
jgi:hypothetical protein